MTREAEAAFKARPEGHCTDDSAWADFTETYSKLGRKQLCGGHLTDFEAAYKIALTMRHDIDHEASLLIAKDRIRWLSIKLAEALAGHAAADTDATRKLARMVELAGVLKAEAADINTGRFTGMAKHAAAARIRAIVEE